VIIMLTDKQAAFVNEYVVDLNATQAAKRAGYSTDTARVIGSQLLAKPEIASAIAEAQKARSERTGVTADRVVTELAKIAFADPRKLMSWGPAGAQVKASAELSEAEAAVVAEIVEGKDGVRLKLHDKVGALDRLAKHLGMYTERVEHQLAVTSPDDLNVVEAARRVSFLLAIADEKTGGEPETLQ
jgi:phage terminase small subunit